MRKALYVALGVILLGASACSDPKPHEAITIEVDWSKYVDTMKPELDREIDNGMCNALHDARSATETINPDDRALLEYIDQGLDIAC